MPVPTWTRAVGAVLTATLIPLGGLAAQAAPAATYDHTSTVEARRSAAVPTPKLGWYGCYGYAECATVRLPLDYDSPKGATTEVALVRVKARNQKAKVGSLFLNPGGPGGSGADIALASPYFLGQKLLDRFDIVGVDPRGTNNGSQVKCFTNIGTQSTTLETMNTMAFPDTASQERAYVASARALGKACSTTGRPLSASMSTAEVARDMDVLRRAVGDRKLSYLGFSYGTYLGQVYANMYPDRVRAVAIDGVLDPIAWAGTPATAKIPQTARLRSGEGAAKTLHEILVRCDKVGGKRCRFAAGNPVANYDLVAQRLRKKPLVTVDPEFGTFTFGYTDLVARSLGAMYSSYGAQEITDNLAELLIATEPPAAGALAATTKLATARRLAATKALARNLRAQKARTMRPGFNFPYDNSIEAASGVLCTDGSNPGDAAMWPAAADAADLKARYFGRLWTWSSAQCAGSTWTAHDEDAYKGPFTRTTASPVLVVGTRWDPATNYDGAVKAANLLPNSRLLSNDNWGHTSYGSSDCATTAIESYLLSQALPARGTVCHGDIQPF
jgi:pimeloyl-ACP methyl ester carboxylesterase